MSSTIYCISNILSIYLYSSCSCYYYISLQILKTCPCDNQVTSTCCRTAIKSRTDARDSRYGHCVADYQITTCTRSPYISCIGRAVNAEAQTTAATAAIVDTGTARITSCIIFTDTTCTSCTASTCCTAGRIRCKCIICTAITTVTSATGTTATATAC